jgi:hypothetical protein
LRSKTDAKLCEYTRHPEHLFRILFDATRNVTESLMFYPGSTQQENIMKKLGYVVAALVSVAIAAPSIASAEDVIQGGDHDRGGRTEFREHGDHDRGARAEFSDHRDHGWRHHRDRVVIIKHRHHEHD